MCVWSYEKMLERTSLVEFFESKGFKSYFSTPYEQWQNGQGESLINSLMTLARSVMVESGLGGQFWFSAALAAKDARNVTYDIKITPYMLLYGKKKDIAKFRAFRCSAYVYLNEEQRGKGKHVPERLRQLISALQRITTSADTSCIFSRHGRS